MTNKKKIILGAPTHFNFSNSIKTGLLEQGFEVIDLSQRLDTPFKYKNILQRVHNLIRKVFLKDRSYKEKLKHKSFLTLLENDLKNVDNVDYALFIRPDLFPIEFIEKVKHKTKKLIAYQWDGLSRFPHVLSYIPLFDFFHVFEQDDLKNHPSTIACTNFYFKKGEIPIVENFNRTYYLGTFFQDRIEVLAKIKSSLERLNFTNEIIISSSSNTQKALIKEKRLEFKKNAITYEENLENVLSSEVLIDIQNTLHDGLSFRIFESIGYDKKLITTNPNISKYDFYTPDNILIWNNQSDLEIKKFYEQPYQSLNTHIKQKYSFENWIKFILKIDGHIPIDIPR
ncbi:hypothetical protein [Sphingobacterium sp. ML3W]|uniref:hypothetical protein n=1 Tax=Sphingobacterium sp. ML3W TaxID=1538644 RepID=UPI00068A63E4|nr:hypothetical protein [Sphingobacterium sp. ML3W]